MSAISEFLSNLNWDSLFSFILRLFAILICLVFHELCHGLTAYWLGDNTAKENHRLTLNPFRHLDVFGTIMMVLVGFGWARPVPVDMRQFKHPKAGMSLTALAGPVSNFLLSYISLLLAYMTLGFMTAAGSITSFGSGCMDFFVTLSTLSMGLAVFNLIPFPPLDGFKVIGVLIPNRIYYWILKYESAGTLILFVLLFFGVLDTPLYAVRSWLMSFMEAGARWPFYLIVH